MRPPATATAGCPATDRPPGVCRLNDQSRRKTHNSTVEEPDMDQPEPAEDAFEMYSYTGGRWMDYGVQHRDDEEAPSMAGTLASYRLLAGESTLDIE